MKFRLIYLFFASLCFIFGAASARSIDGVEDVYRYFSDLDTFHAQFTQDVRDSEGAPVQQSEGEVWIQRPGRFRWNYLTPFRQEVVANGIELWTFDPELEQATVKTIDKVLAVTPAMLLSGMKKLRDVATIDSLGTADKQQWYKLTPKDVDDAVDQVQVAFRDSRLSAIRVDDSFGNTTVINFSDQQLNKPVSDYLFSIELPAGTDILGTE